MVTLRLDDASIVSVQDGVATRMNPAKALTLNRLGEKDCVRLEQFLVTARSMAPQVAVDPMPSMASQARVSFMSVRHSLSRGDSNIIFELISCRVAMPSERG